MPDYLLGIDRGTTNIKAVLFDLDGKEIIKSVCPCEDISHPLPGWSEQNMDMIWEVAKKSIKNLWSEEIKSSNVIAIGFSGQGSGLFAIDKSGNPIRNGIVSTDIRAKKLVDSLNSSEIIKEVYKISRGSFFESSPIILLKWLKENEPENYKKIDKILFSKDWIKFKLTGEICTEPTDASGGILMDVENNNYSNKLFEIAEITESWGKLPVLLPSYKICGKVNKKAAKETGLTQDIPVVTGAHDICAVSFAAGGIEEGHLTTTLGTWGLNMAVLDNPQQVKNNKGLIYTIFSIVPKKGILVTGDANSGSALKWFVDQFCEEEKQEANKQKIDVYKICDEKIRKINPEDLKLIHHPFLNGSPAIKSTARAGFYGIGAWHNKIDLLRSIYEGVSYSQCNYIENIKKFIEIREHWLVGGGAKSHVWAQMFADVIGSEIFTSGEDELAAKGAALCAGLGVGAYKDFKEIKKLCNGVERIKIFKPQTHTRMLYLKKYNIYKKLINRMDDIWEDLNDLF
jgi:sugar (pentulose or hexulose) kinase